MEETSTTKKKLQGHFQETSHDNHEEIIFQLSQRRQQNYSEEFEDDSYLFGFLHFCDLIVNPYN